MDQEWLPVVTEGKSEGVALPGQYGQGNTHDDPEIKCQEAWLWADAF